MTRTPRLVLDTNVVVSALLWGGRPLELLTLAAERDVRLYSSARLLAELAATLAKPKLARAVVASGRSAKDHVADYRGLVTLVPPALHHPVSRDADDDHVIACAFAARADCIVTRDDDLLSLGDIGGVVIREVAAVLVPRLSFGPRQEREKANAMAGALPPTVNAAQPWARELVRGDDEVDAMA